MTTSEGPIAAAAVGFVNAIGGVLIAFNVVLTQTQLAAVDACVNAGVILAGVVVLALRPAAPKGPGSGAGP